MKKIAYILYVALVITIVGSSYYINNHLDQKEMISQNESDTMEAEFVYGEITELYPMHEDGQMAVIKLESGKKVNAKIGVEYNYNTYQKEQAVRAYKTTNLITGESTYDIVDYYHGSGLFMIFIIFSALVVIIARKKGFFSLVSIMSSLILFYYLFLNLIKFGVSPILACLIFVCALTLITIPLIHGFNLKSLSTIVSVILGYVISLVVTLIFTMMAYIGPASSEDLRTLTLQFPEINLSEILIAAIFLGAVGALIDTSITISSAIFESQKENLKVTFKKACKIGMEIGKDILGSMTNTLLIAYLAASMPFLVLLSLGQFDNLRELVNYEFISMELVRIFVGGASLVILIPITTIVSSYLLMKQLKTNK
ncbi:YibE/F family protein [Patescibacteria group bacterium]|nr:YibE/F family protein [Patescibacteria group bacterium]